MLEYSLLTLQAKNKQFHTMKVAIVVLALVAVAAADSYGKAYTQTWNHVPYYKFDWDVTAQGGYAKDGYSAGYGDEALQYAQYETRSADHTTGNWNTQLPGKSHMKVDYDVNAQVYQAQAYAAPAYKADYKPAYKADYKPAY